MTGPGDGPPAGAGSERERGTVTAEFAVLMPLAVLMLQLVVGAGVVGVADVRCADAARTAARMAARGEPAALVLAAARAAAPPGAAVQLETGDGGMVRVVVRARVSLPLPLRPGIGLSAASTAALETDSG